jgi:hypothetical protein
VRPIRRGNGNRALPRVLPIERGEGLAVYPDDETVAAMKAEGWSAVKVGFKQNDEGQLAELFLCKSVDDAGVIVRYYEGQRTNIHVTVKNLGSAIAKPDAKACSVRRETDDEPDAFVFDVSD